MKMDFPQVDLPTEVLAWTNVTEDILNIYKQSCRLQACIVAICTEGSMKASINLLDYEIRPNDLITLLPGTIIQFRERTEKVCLCFVGFSAHCTGRVNLMKNIGNAYPKLLEQPVVPLSEDVAGYLKDYFALLSRASCNENFDMDPELVELSLQTILTSIRLIYHNYPGENSSSNRKKEICRELIQSITEHYKDELQFILDRRLLDHTMVNCHGMNSRVKSRDVLSVSVQHIAATNADKEYILLNLARNSIYHQLPELLFHPLVLSTPGMSNKEIVEAIRANEKQDKELIQFFAPFDTEFFKEKVRINNRHLNFFSDPDSKKNFIKMIEVMENVELSITSHQKYKLFLFLCNAERYKENLPAIEQLLLIVLGLKVKLRLEVHEIDETVYLSVGSGCVGQTLGLNGLMISETDDLTATIILDTPTDDYEEVKTHLSNVRRILEFFILSTRNIEVDYLVRGETDFILGENRLGYNMNL